MIITRSVDIEDVIRTALSPYQTAYCAPLPTEYALPCILVTVAGGSSERNQAGRSKVDTFTVILDARAELESDAMEYLRNAIGILENIEIEGLSHITTNSLYSWGTDPVRPDLAMCSATLLATSHRETTTI